MSFQVKIVISQLFCEQDVYFLAVLRTACQVSDDNVVFPPLGLSYLLRLFALVPLYLLFMPFPLFLLFPLLQFFHLHLLLCAKAVLACVYSCSRQLEIRAWKKK